MRRKILRLYYCRQRILPLIPHHSLNGASPVETQNVASPVIPIAIHSSNNMLDNNRIYPLVRRKILRLYFCWQRILPLIPHHSLNGASPVETQNVASPVIPIAIHSSNNMLDNNRIYPLVRRKILCLYFSRHTYCPLMHRYSLNGASPVETQNLASPVLPIAIHPFNNMLDNNRIYPLVIRKILRLYFCR